MEFYSEVYSALLETEATIWHSTDTLPNSAERFVSVLSRALLCRDPLGALRSANDDCPAKR